MLESGPCAAITVDNALKCVFPPGGSRWVNEPARASEPLGVHWGNFAESRVLKQTWLRDGRTDGRTDGPDRI